MIYERTRDDLKTTFAIVMGVCSTRLPFIVLALSCNVQIRQKNNKYIVNNEYFWEIFPFKCAHFNLLFCICAKILNLEGFNVTL